MQNPSQDITVNENTAQEVSENIDQNAPKNGHSDVNKENAPKIKVEILRILIDVNTNELEWPLHTKENPHPTYSFCGKNKVDRISAHIMMFLYSMFLTLSQLTQSTVMHFITPYM